MPKNADGDSFDEFIDELKPGTNLLQGQYTIVRFINAGGFGMTYLAKNSLDRDMVIKECFPGSFCRRSQGAVEARSRAHQNEFAQIVRLFVQEAKSLSKLVHPNIVGVHQVFEDNNTAYMAIDYIEGRDLLDMLETDRDALKPAVIVAMLKKLLGAIGFVHDNGMLHRDISPDNILVSKSGEPVLIDFGAARQQAGIVGGKALSAMRVVKDGYSPQEFYVGGVGQNPSSDLYALAATFYHVITGEVPPNSQSRLVAIAERRGDPYRPLAGRVAGYPDGFLEAIDTALKVLPKDRLLSAQAWLNLIATRPELKVVSVAKAESDPLEGAESVEARPEGAPADISVEAPDVAAASLGAADSVFAHPDLPLILEDVAEEKAGRNPAIFAGALAAALVLAIGLGVMLFGSGPEEPALAESESGAAVPASETEAGTVDVAAAEPEASALPETDASADSNLAAALPAGEEISAGSSEPAPEETGVVAEANPVVEASAAEEAPALPTPPDVAALPEADAPAAPDAASETAETELAAESAPEEEYAPATAEDTPAAVAAPVADPTVSDRQVISVAWSARLPFDLVLQGENAFPAVSNASADTAAFEHNSWVADGVMIYAVNGAWVKTADEIADEIGRMTMPTNGEPLFVPVRIKRAPDAALEEVTLALVPHQEIVLKNGVEAATWLNDGVWRTVITGSGVAGLLPDDVLIAEKNTDMLIDSPSSVEQALSLLAENDMPSALFEVLRGGAPMTTEMPLAKDE
jgi:serine/threonine protein kinase